MVSSMTGFGRAEIAADGRAFTVEVRTVNHRHLAVKLKAPARFLRHEGQFEDAVRAQLSRGSVDVFVRSRGRAAGTGSDAPRIDLEALGQYARTLGDAARRLDLAGGVTLSSLLALPGVVGGDDDEVGEGEVAAVGKALDKALKQVAKARQDEGERLAVELESILGRIAAEVEAIGQRADVVPDQYKRKLKKRIEALLAGTEASLDAGTLEREVAVFADRCDVREELARLGSHVEGFTRMLAKKGPIGRSLDFLVQEMGREANTIGSKLADAEAARRVVALKTEIERLREQAANLE